MKHLETGILMFIVVYNLNLNMRPGILSVTPQMTIGGIIYTGLLLILQPQIFTTVKTLKQR